MSTNNDWFQQQKTPILVTANPRPQHYPLTYISFMPTSRFFNVGYISHTSLKLNHGGSKDSNTKLGGAKKVAGAGGL